MKRETMRRNRRKRLTPVVIMTLVWSVALSIPPTLGEAQAQPATVYPKPDRLAGQGYPTYYGGYRMVAGFSAFMADVADSYPELVRRVNYGKSWLKTQDPATGHKLEALCITANVPKNCELDPHSRKPRFMLIAQMHAREITSSELAWRFVTKLLDGYSNDAEVTALLDHTEVWVIPQANPDGVDAVQQGMRNGGTGENSRAWNRKNVNNDNPSKNCPLGEYGAGPGVDLNRNWPTHWGEIEGNADPCVDSYRGKKPLTEPENIALADLLKKLFEDQRGTGGATAPSTTRGALVSLHSSGNLVLMPWLYDATAKAPNEAGLRSLAFRMGYYNGYKTGRPGEVLYNASRALDDWVYDRFGIPAFTYEIGPDEGDCGHPFGFFPDYQCQSSFWELNAPAIMYAAKSARQPYATVLGPVVSGLTVGRSAGTSVSVTAIADDNAYSDRGSGRPAAQRVVAAEIYFGRPPWNGGRVQTLQVSGSGFTADLSGNVTTIETLRNLAYVRAKDANGNWGPTTTAWLPAR